MKRREFLQYAVPAAAVPVMVGGISVKALADSPLLDAMLGSSIQTDRVLVIIEMNGGNDGLNTIIPLDQYATLAPARANIIIQDTKVLKMINETGFHPSMAGIHAMYQEGVVKVVQSVGYPNPNFSHFRASDIWNSASDSDQVVPTGWLGRYLNEEYPGFPDNYPNPTNPDPLAIQIGSVLSQSLQGPLSTMGMAITSADSFYQLLSGATDVVPNTPAGHELKFIRQVIHQTQEYVIQIQAAAAAGANLSTQYPTNNYLASQLKIVARLIKGGLKTRVYVVSIGGFDTHDSQIDQTQGTDTGLHADLLGRLSSAIAAFQDDLKLLDIDERVVGMTFSEFGRRIKSNASFGTDHGAAAPLIVFGKRVLPGILGSNPIIPSNPDSNDNIAMQYDFRQIYASLLQDWFGLPQATVENILIGSPGEFPVLPIINNGIVGVQNNFETDKKSWLKQNYPNPVTESTVIKFETEGGLTRIQLFDNQGRLIETIIEASYSKGEHEINYRPSNLAGGTYYYRLQNGKNQDVKTMMVK